MRIMAQSVESTTINETMRLSLDSNRRTTLIRPPSRFSTKTLNWRTLGQSRPRAVSNSTLAPSSSPRLMLAPSEVLCSIRQKGWENQCVVDGGAASCKHLEKEPRMAKELTTTD